MTKVSVLVPIYNVEKYLDECLASLAKQTLKDIEIICINDGSTDNSPKILQKYAKKYPNFIVINKQNSGYGDSMNKGLEKATGEYISIVESDDFIESDAFEKLYKLAHETKADIVKANYFYHSKDGDVLHEVIKNQKLGTPLSLADDTSILLEEPGSGRQFIVVNSCKKIKSTSVQLQRRPIRTRASILNLSTPQNALSIQMKPTCITE